MPGCDRARPLQRIDPERGLRARFDRLSLETTGVFEDYKGEPIPF